MLDQPRPGRCPVTTGLREALAFLLAVALGWAVWLLLLVIVP